jgi:Lipid A 3-O-deacylase (PagL)
MKRWLVVVGMLLGTMGGLAQDTGEFSRKNTWTVFAENSNTSSHILMGSARERRLVDLGFGYSRRVVRFWGSDLSYQVELRPVVFESDPLTIDHFSQTITFPGQPPFTATGVSSQVNNGKCQPASSSFTIVPIDPTQPTFTDQDNFTCGRQWTFGQAFSPLGFKYSMRTRHRVQPYIVGTLGYMYTSRPVPLAEAEAFNFLFNFGPGVEVYRSGKRSISVAYLYSHFSNRDTAEANPGTDNMMLKVSYNFGR